MNILNTSFKILVAFLVLEMVNKIKEIDRLTKHLQDIC